MIQTYIYTGVAFLAGFLIAWIIRTIRLAKTGKLLKSTEGYLESEKLMKEKLQRENAQVHQMKQSLELAYKNKLKKAMELTKLLDEDIMLLQKSNEETEALLKSGEPALHSLKLQLIEANNEIARYKSQLGLKEIKA